MQKLYYFLFNIILNKLYKIEIKIKIKILFVTYIIFLKLFLKIKEIFII